MPISQSFFPSFHSLFVSLSLQKGSLGLLSQSLQLLRRSLYCLQNRRDDLELFWNYNAFRFTARLVQIDFLRFISDGPREFNRSLYVYLRALSVFLSSLMYILGQPVDMKRFLKEKTRDLKIKKGNNDMSLELIPQHLYYRQESQK